MRTSSCWPSTSPATRVPAKVVLKAFTTGVPPGRAAGPPRGGGSRWRGQLVPALGARAVGAQLHDRSVPKRRASARVRGDLGSAPVGGDAVHEPLHVDDEALVGALTDRFVFVVGLDPEEQSPPIRRRCRPTVPGEQLPLDRPMTPGRQAAQGVECGGRADRSAVVSAVPGRAVTRAIAEGAWEPWAG